jgi:predicted  nucleic acid-binding Zn-ribbon protein
MEKSIETKLQELVDLQIIDSKLDKIRQIRGGLPQEVRELEDELAGLELKIKRIQNEISETENEIAQRNRTIKESEEAIRKYDRQIMEVKNNREFEALNKEIELARLEIMTCERKINHFKAFLDQRNEELATLNVKFKEREAHLKTKQAELSEITTQTQELEEKLQAASEKASAKIEARLLNYYKKVRNSVRNGLAVVVVDRGACAGSGYIIPPQQQLEIQQKKGIIISESCGRIMVDNSFFANSEMNKIFADAMLSFGEEEVANSDIPLMVVPDNLPRYEDDEDELVNG